MSLKRKLLTVVGVTTFSTTLNKIAINGTRNTRNTDYTYNGEVSPNFDIIDSNDWDRWCDINSEYNRTDGKGYKNKYFVNREDFNFGICPFTIDDAVVQLVSNVGYMNFTDPTAGEWETHAMLLTSRGEVYSWGANRHGQVGNGDTDEVAKPTKISGLSNIVAISTSRYSSIALDKYGQVWGWGGEDSNGHGGEVQLTPKIIAGLIDIVSIKSSHYGFYVLNSIGEIYSWGESSPTYPTIGDGADIPRNTPVNISKTEGSILNGIRIKSISRSYIGGRALDYNGNMYVWGYNYNSSLGLGSNDDTSKSLPVKVELENIEKIYDSTYSSIVKTNDGKVYGVGAGAPGLGLTSDWQEMPWADNLKSIISNYSTLVIDNQGRLIVAGFNGHGELGLGDTEDKSTPTENELGDIIIAEGSNYVSFCLNSNGNIYSFGANNLSSLGINIHFSETKDVTKPVKMIRSKPSYIVSTSGEIGANSKDDYKYIYTKKHPNKQAVIDASPIQMTSRNSNSPRYHINSTITNDDYITSSDYFTNSIGGEMCSEAGHCFSIPEIREPDEDSEGPNFNPDHPDYGGGISDEYELARMKPVAFSITEGEQSSINIPLFNGGHTNSRHIKINKLGQLNDNLVILMEIYSYDNQGKEVLLTTEKFDNKGINKGNFVIEATNYYRNQKKVVFKFRTYLNIDANKTANGSIKYYSSTQTFTHSPLPTTGNNKYQFILLIITVIIVAGGALTAGFFYIKSRRRPNRY